jgi:hypothetical protein
MIKYCPIISYHKEYCSEKSCMKNDCMFWNEEVKQCVLVLAAQAIAANGGKSPQEQARYIPPTAIPNPNINNPYVTFSITP